MASPAHGLARFCRAIDTFTEFTGRAVSWLTLALVLVTCTVVILRYVLSSGSIALQETMSYLHATLFMLGIAFTLKRGGHVRVDVFYRGFSPRRQALVDVLGTLFFLLPVSVLILVYCWDYVLSSWAIRETSSEGGGLPLVYLLKTLMLVMPVTLVIQGVSEAIKNGLFFLGLGGSHTEEHLGPI
jgi:TRAP-type mannitol/chloroaromatic compound transport system permease small subunit